MANGDGCYMRQESDMSSQEAPDREHEIRKVRLSGSHSATC
jgi:hypothetical protein